MTKNHIDYLANVEQARHNRKSEQQNEWNLTIQQQQADVASKNAETARLSYKADKKYKEQTGKAALINAKASKSQARSAKSQAKSAARQAGAAEANAYTNRLAAQWLHDYQEATILVDQQKNQITKDYNETWLDQKQKELEGILKRYDIQNSLTKAQTAKEASNIITNFSHAINEWYNSAIRKGELKVKQGKLKVDRYNAITNNLKAQYEALEKQTKSFANLAKGVNNLINPFANMMSAQTRAASKGTNSTPKTPKAPGKNKTNSKPKKGKK